MRIFKAPEVAQGIMKKVVRIPYKSGATAVLNVKSNTEVLNTATDAMDIVEISGKVLRKGKEIEKVNYRDANGFSLEQFARVAEELQAKAKEGFDVISELLR